MEQTCKKCGKAVSEKDVGSRGATYVRCRSCTMEILKGAKPAGILNVTTGELRKKP